MTIGRYWRILALVAAVGLMPPVHSHLARAQDAAEKILSFHSDITVNPDGSMLVRETIKVRSAGDQIKRGIYRDFPTRYSDRLGNRYTVGFEVLEVQRDGRPEPYHTDSISNGERAYMGEKSTFLSPGEYTYSLLYRTDRELGYFADHDELYWNATGHGWAFPIEKATVTVGLPKGIQRDAVILEAYTGPEGSLGTAFTSWVDGEVRGHFATTKRLEAAEGLTIVVSWPKGFIAEPTREMAFGYFLRDNLSSLIGGAGFLVLLLYYLVAWLLVGRDPSKGIIMPLYEPPAGLSPAAVRYLTQMGFDDKTFGAAIVDLAVKKYLTIQEKDGEYVLVRAKGEKAALSPEEKAIGGKLLEPGERIELKATNHARIRSAVESLKTHLQLNLEKIYFLTNRRYLIPGLVFSAVLLIFIALSAPGENKPVAMFMTIWLTGWSIGVFFLVSQVIRSWRSVKSGSGIKATSLAAAVFITLFSIPFLIGEAAGIYVLTTATSVPVIVLLGLVALAHYVFHHLLKAPTHAGRQLLDRIDGFKMFLTATEKDRLDVLLPTRKTPELFERYLPYAMALDVEEQWSEQFAEVLATAGKGGTSYSPGWYSGASWNNLGTRGFGSSLGSSFSGAIASSASPPGSRSGSGGGGSSGGGGGGGGGGGW